VVLSTILPGHILLGVVIFVHELGHFIAAKWRGVTVLKWRCPAMSRIRFGYW